MRLFRRIGDIVTANLNDLVDRFEDPELMLRQALREMNDMIEDTTGAAARAIAGERLLARDLADHGRKAQTWRARAEEAVIRNDDDLARRSLTRAREHEALAAALVHQHVSALRAAEALRGQVEAMKAKQAEARRKLASLSARRQVVEAGRALRGTGRDTSRGPRGFARFERMQHQFEQAEAEADALAELHGELRLDAEVAASAGEHGCTIEAELAALKQRLRSAKEPPGP